MTKPLQDIATKKKPKSQSKKMRNMIYRLWELRGKPGDSEEYYQNYTEGIIKQIGRKIDQIETGY